MTDQRSDRPAAGGPPPRPGVPDVWDIRPTQGPPPRGAGPWRGRAARSGPPQQGPHQGPPGPPQGPPPGARPGPPVQQGPYGPPNRPMPQRVGPGPQGPQGPPMAGPPPLLTHDPSTSGPDDRPTSLALADPPGPPPRRPGTGGGGDGDGGGGRPGGRKRLVRRIVLWSLAALIVGPFLAFAIGWVAFKVPSADDVANTQVATFTFADGSPLATVRPNNINRVNVTLDQVPEPVQHAVLSAEDRSFFSNPGFDISGIGRAVWSQLTGGIGGGSTITQQYIKVTTGQDQFSLWRKYKEIVLAAKISKEQTKQEILENYLNAIYLGRGAYGIQAASQAYFGKDVQQLNASEGAMLAGLIQSPSRWDPAKNEDKSRERWNFVLDGEVQMGWMTPAERAQQQYPRWVPPSSAEGGIPGDANGHIYNQVRAELEQNGISEAEINTEGLTVQTTIDPDKQKDAVDAANQVLKGQPDNLRTALVSVDPKTGAVLAYFGGNDGVGLDYAQASKQPGSSFKPFVLAAALQQPEPIGLGTQYDGSSPQTLAGQKVSNSEGVSCARCSVKTAMTQSINTVFYKMALDIGPQKVADAAIKAGIPAAPLANPTGGISLGDKNVTTENMAAAFATFAADGVARQPYLVAKVTTSDGRVIYDHGAGSSAGTQAFSQQVARNVTESMTDVASSSRIGLRDGRPVAAKTGTVQSSIEGQNNDAWTVGYTPQIATAVWVGTDDNSPIKNSAGRPVYGRMLPGSIWQQYMSDALRGTDVEPWSKFTPIGQAPVSDYAGQSPAPTRSADSNDDGEDGRQRSGRDSGDNGDSGNNGNGNSGRGNNGNGNGNGGDSGDSGDGGDRGDGGDG